MIAKHLVTQKARINYISPPLLVYRSTRCKSLHHKQTNVIYRMRKMINHPLQIRLYVFEVWASMQGVSICTANCQLYRALRFQLARNRHCFVQKAYDLLLGLIVGKLVTKQPQARRPRVI